MEDIADARDKNAVFHPSTFLANRHDFFGSEEEQVAGHVPRFAVLDGVVYSFLRNVVQVHAHAVIVNQHRLDAIEAAADLEHVIDLARQLFQGGHKAEGIGHDGDQAARKVPGFADRFVDQLYYFFGGRGFGKRFFRELLFQDFTHEGDAREVLAQAIVEVLANPALLPAADIENGLFQPLRFGNIDPGNNDVFDRTAPSDENCARPRDAALNAPSGSEGALERIEQFSQGELAGASDSEAGALIAVRQ